MTNAPVPATLAPPAASPSFDTLARAQILLRLREALDLAEAAAPDPGRLQHLLDDARDRLRAWSMAAAAISPAPPRPLSRCTSVLAGAGEPVAEFLLIPFGFVQVDGPLAGRDFHFTQRHAHSAQRWFERLGRKLAIDYEHQSIEPLNNRDDGLRPAAGWIGGLAVRDDGLWATQVAWTSRAAELLRSGEYRYFSPVIYWTDEDYSDVAALGPVALTNDPAMCGVTPLAAARGVAAAPGAPPAEGQLSPAAAPGAPHSGAALVPRTLLARAEQEIAALRQRIREQEADAFIAGGLRSGKIVESTRGDWRSDYLADSVRANERLARAPVVLPPGRVQGGAPPVAEFTPTAHGGTAGGAWCAEPADFAAFEQALAAGRLRLGGTVG